VGALSSRQIVVFGTRDVTFGSNVLEEVISDPTRSTEVISKQRADEEISRYLRLTW
jgi:hypothetical protein